MCAILDNSVVGKVFGQHDSEMGQESAGQKFFEWITSGKGSLVVGGKLRDELDGSSDFRKWWQEAGRAGRVTVLDDSRERKVTDKTRELIDQKACKSNDHHIIVLAQISGARFLYSDDAALHVDFKDKRLIDNPRGVVYSTQKDDTFTSSRRRMLSRKVCRI